MDKELKNEFEKIGTRFEKMDERFEALIGFLHKNMATKDDISELRAEMPGKELIDKLYNVADKLTTEVIGYRTEQTVTASRLENIDNWITKAAPKIGVDYKQ